METFIKIMGVIVALLVPLALAYINNKLAHLKYSHESKNEFLKLAKDFEEKEIENQSILYKDRFAKSLFNIDTLTYEEAKFFCQYENADLWVKEYAKIRTLIKRERDEVGRITRLIVKHHWSRPVLGFLGYVLFASIGFIPFVMMNKFIGLVVDAYNKGIPLIIFIIILIPLASLYLGYFCLRYVEKYGESKNFILDFYKYAFRVDTDVT